MHSTARKILMALLTGALVALATTGVRLLLDSETGRYHGYIADATAGLVSMLVSLGIYLHFESQYYRFALERAAVFSEINHHVRNAIFPLCMAVQNSGDPNALRLSQEAIDRINVALRDAVTDVFSHKVAPVVRAKQKSAA